MKKLRVQELTIIALFVAVGIILPMIFHSFGMGGPMFLPMHIPVLIGSALISPSSAILLGTLTPIMSSLLTGMPPVYPMLPIMIFELATYAFVISYLEKNTDMNIYLQLVISMIAGRIMAGLVVALLFFGLGFQTNPVNFIIGAIVTGLPGIAIQFIIVPPLQMALKNLNRRVAMS